MHSITEPAREVPVVAEVDVLVCGGGPAGVGAALAAARQGARTLLLENQLCLGGSGTSGMLNRLGPYHDQKDIILGGIPWEILETLRARGMAGPPTPTSPKDWQNYWLVFDPEAMKLLLDELVREAEVRVLFNARIAAAIVVDGAIRGVCIESKSGRQAVLAQVVIDCTGDGDVAAWAGAPYDKGRAADGKMQPFTLFSKALNMDWPRAFDYVKANYGALLPQAQALGNDFILAGTDNYLHPEETYFNCLHAFDKDGTDVADISLAAMELRAKMWRNLEVLRRHVPGCENVSLITSAAAMGVRETRHIQGEYRLTIGDVLEARQFRDQVMRYACFVDIHKVDKEGKHSAYHDMELQPGQSYGIPYQTLLPRQIENLLVAGRCFSATHEALASARMMPACMAMGQAVGTAAALCVETGITPRQVDTATLRTRLTRQGVIL